MMHAYDRNYLERARISLGRMLDYAVRDLENELGTFWEMFLASPLCRQFEFGDVSVLAGRSGVELALAVLGRDRDYAKPIFSEEKSPEYWTGWALAYYQWKTCLSFAQITARIPIEEVRMLYSPYHEMDIRQFCDRMSTLYAQRQQTTNLKQRRLLAGLSQSRLAAIAGIPIRTLQQYEQRQKDIGKAKAETVLALSRALCCDPHLLLESELAEAAV